MEQLMESSVLYVQDLFADETWVRFFCYLWSVLQNGDEMPIYVPI